MEWATDLEVIVYVGPPWGVLLVFCNGGGAGRRGTLD